jgi:hypothetical protein
MTPSTIVQFRVHVQFIAGVCLFGAMGVAIWDPFAVFKNPNFYRFLIPAGVCALIS